MTPPNIPRVYRWWHLWIEPAAALGGSRLLWCLPETYHEYMPITAEWSPKSKIIYDQLAACYLLFAFNQAITLRVVHDVYVWKVLLFGMALSDAAHVYSLWAEMGASVFLSPGGWRTKDWVTVVTTAGPFFLRVAFILGIGLAGSKKERKSA
ncbi:uncharacterized protein M421DRAFT_419501 [Didymella exigua CBS 183.55]|uniref:DUF7704 domain-containing protein n=1 Tax=Didymella exigua CBS 183.55 TaxID=1150837 RepID=A0A6A5RMR3_9PLEO|nr:uncharacterized protein M421DRAFT_419501 [Didymella exigua CBS 183.55]KAF1929715.1 hypothetical protein M421DRAFT_419501 [Didymella exigua CBS 183.55]